MSVQRRFLDEHGHEVPDPVPLSLPVGFKRPETLQEQVQRLVRGAISRQAQLEGKESFEESEDFDVEDEVDPSTPYETFFDPVLGKELTPSEFRQHEQLYRERYLRAQADYFGSLDRTEALKRSRSPAGAQPSQAPAPAVEPQGVPEAGN